jgi:glycosyltransferase involved in cell wall biosynthesis
MPKISVIVPVYNVRDYLEKCVSGVRAQTFGDWELILVNDGSTDGSGELCRALAGEDGRIVVLERPNGGAAAARNTGLDAASGDTVTFLDADDSFAPDHLESLHSLLESAGADAAASGMTLVYPGGSDERAVRPDAGIFRGKEEILRAFLIDGRGIYGACGKLFRRAAVGDVRFSAYTRAEDALFCVRVLSRCGVYAVTDAAGYLYYRRPDSVTMRGRDERSIDQVRAWTEIYGIIEKTAPELCRFAAEKICHDIDALFPLGGAAGRELKALRETYYPLKFPGGRLPAGKIPAAILYRISPRAYYSLIRDRWARERRES